MRRREMDRYRSLLEQKRADLMERVREALAGAGEQGEGAPDLGDRALSTTSQEMLLQLSSGERRTLKLLDEALRRVDQGTFGRCVNCGAPIQLERLKAVPWARHCFECEELQDHGKI